MTVGPSALAKALGVSRDMVARYRRAGKITPDENGQYDLDTARAQLAATLRPKRGGPERIGERAENYGSAPAEIGEPEVQFPAEPTTKTVIVQRQMGAPPKGTLAYEQLRLERARTTKALIDIRRIRGELIPKDECRHEWGRMISAARAAILMLPAKVAPRVAAIGDVLECQAILEREVRALLNELKDYKPDAERETHAA